MVPTSNVQDFPSAALLKTTSVLQSAASTPPPPPRPHPGPQPSPMGAPPCSSPGAARGPEPAAAHTWHRAARWQRGQPAPPQAINGTEVGDKLPAVRLEWKSTVTPLIHRMFSHFNQEENVLPESLRVQNMANARRMESSHMTWTDSSPQVTQSLRGFDRSNFISLIAGRLWVNQVAGAEREVGPWSRPLPAAEIITFLNKRNACSSPCSDSRLDSSHLWFMHGY